MDLNNLRASEDEIISLTIEQENSKNPTIENQLNNLECERTLTISSDGYDLPSPVNNESKEKFAYERERNVSEINYGRRYDENMMKQLNVKTKNNDEFLKFISDNSGKFYFYFLILTLLLNFILNLKFTLFRNHIW